MSLEEQRTNYGVLNQEKIISHIKFVWNLHVIKLPKKKQVSTKQGPLPLAQKGN
jgi:hypothetical protein